LIAATAREYRAAIRQDRAGWGTTNPEAPFRGPAVRVTAHRGSLDGP